MKIKLTESLSVKILRLANNQELRQTTNIRLPLLYAIFKIFQADTRSKGLE